MKDRFNREISYMRISLTDRCNFRCRYCMPEKGIEKTTHDEIISLEEVLRIVKTASKFGIKKIRLTGGEPLVRKGIVYLCSEIKKIKEIEELCITTNGGLIKDMGKDLKEAGVDRLNFSLDTLDEKKFSYITRRDKLKDVLEGLKIAYDLGFKIKINTVLIGGFNDDEIEDLVDLTKDLDIQIRFIELMKMGETKDWSDEKFLENSKVLEVLEDLEPLSTEGVAKVFKRPGYKGTVGLISPVSHSFCSDCNRIRLTADGKLKPCLHSKEEISLKGLDSEELEKTMKKALFYKPKRHHLEEGTETDRTMNAIGG